MAEILTPESFTSGPAALRVSPLAHLHQELAAAAVPGGRGVVLQEIPFLCQVGLRAVSGSSGHRRLVETLGTGLPASVGEVTGAAEALAVLWLGPDEFLVVAVTEEHGLSRLLREALGDHPGQVVDLSAHRTVIEVRGGSARDALEKGVPADLHPRQFPTGRAITTTLGPVPVLLWRTEEEAYRVLVRASFADYLARWLMDAVREYRHREAVAVSWPAG